MKKARSDDARSSRWLTRILIGCALGALAAAGPGAPAPAAPHAQALPAEQALNEAGSATQAPVSAARRKQAIDAYRKLPLAFVPNAGQSDERVRYLAQGASYGFFFTDHGVTLSFTHNTNSDQLGRHAVALELGFRGASPEARLVASKRAAGTVSYLAGADPDQRRAGLATYSELTYRDLWPGIDLVFRGQGGKLKYEFHVAPGADPSRIQLAYRGAEGLALGAGGALRIGTALGTLKDSRPVSYQRAGGRRVSVASRYRLQGDAGYGFALPLGYVRSQPLVIDPGLDYSTFLGGTASDQGQAIAVDSAGSAYVTGLTDSADFPTTLGAFDTSINGGDGDAFVTKLNASGSALVYSTFLGGTGFDGGRGIAVDGAGSAYVTGDTNSADFPTTPGALDTIFNGVFDAFVTKLNASGSAPVYSTFLGGTGVDQGQGIAVDSTGSAYVTGLTHSADFPTTPGAFDTSNSFDAFVTKLNASGSALDYSTFLGGTGFDRGQGIAVDGAGSAYVTGRTDSADFPTTPGAFDTIFNGSDDAFVTKLNASGSALDYSTFLGGTVSDFGFGIAIDGVGSAYVTGFTGSADFPTTPGAFDTILNGSNDAFVTKLNASGSALVYSTFLGGTVNDFGLGIAIDGAGSAYVTGRTDSADFPTTPGAFDTSANGGSDAFVTKLSTGSVPATLTLSPAADTNPVGTSHTVTATVADVDGNPVEGVTVRFTVAGSVSASGACTTDANGQCDFTYAGPEFPGADVITAYADTNENGVQDAGEPGAEATKSWVLPASTPGQVSGGGTIEDPSDNKIAFGFSANENNGVQGQCNVVEPKSHRMIKCLNVTALVITGNEATIYGDATDNGTATTYVIRVKDVADPGKDADTFSIQTASGYSRSGVLTGGNVRVG